MNPSWITDFEFHCCYLINPREERHKNKCYIGYSNQPDIRIRQHNRERKGGAKKTGRYQNWRFNLIVYDFPNKLSALQFEYAFQNPHKSRQLTQVDLKNTVKEKKLKFKHQVLINLLKVKLYKNFNLKVAIFDSNTFDSIIKSVNNNEELSISQFKLVESLADIYPDKFNIDTFLDLIPPPDESKCKLCNNQCTVSEIIYCPNQSCVSVYHQNCLLTEFQTLICNENNIIPNLGFCSICFEEFKWIEWIRFTTKVKHRLDEINRSCYFHPSSSISRESSPRKTKY